MNSVLSLIPAVAATVFLFLSSLNGVSTTSNHQMNWTTPKIETRVEPNEQPLQTAVVAQGQLAFAAVPGASNYSFLVSPECTTSSSQPRVFRAVVDDTPPAIGTNDNDGSMALAQVNPQDNRPTRIAFQETAAADGTVPSPAAVALEQADEVSIEIPAEESDQSKAKPTRRIYLGAGVTVRGWRNAMRGPAPASQAEVSPIPPAAPVTEP